MATDMVTATMAMATATMMAGVMGMTMVTGVTAMAMAILTTVITAAMTSMFAKLLKFKNNVLNYTFPRTLISVKL